MNTAIQPGYKQTEVGVIPEDWDIRKLGDVFHLINGCAFKPSDWKQNGTPIIRIQNLNDPDATFNYSQAPVPEANRVEAGDLLFAWSGTIGSSFGARLWNGPSGVLNQHIFKVLMDQEEIAKSFALLVFARVEDDIAKQAHGFKASFVHVKKSDLTKINLPVPPIHEQTAIASALSDVDALLDSLDRLIAKKRDIKQAAMQQLLTGKMRLPGFEGEWGVKQLIDAVIFQRGFDLPHHARRTGNVPIVSSSGACDTHDVAPVSAPGVVTGRYGTIGEVFFVEEDFWPLNTTLFVKDFRGNDPLFMSFFLRTIDYQSHSGKSGVPGVNRNDLHVLVITLPPVEEQIAIARVLSDMDAEIEALEKRRAKTREIKQAMMQELLTGRTRLA